MNHNPRLLFGGGGGGKVRGFIIYHVFNLARCYMNELDAWDWAETLVHAWQTTSLCRQYSSVDEAARTLLELTYTTLLPKKQFMEEFGVIDKNGKFLQNKPKFSTRVKPKL